MDVARTSTADGSLGSALDVRKVTGADIPRVATALARAFYDDPLIGGWVFAGESRRMKRLERGFHLYARRLWLRHGACYTTAGGTGAAMWMPPETWRLGVLEQVRLLPHMVAAFGSNLPRLMRALSSFEAGHPHEPHYYLPAIGVEPEWQGHGIGTSLLQPVLESCDEERLPAYLESTSPRNVPLYERHGFQITDEVTVGDSPPYWRMWREPLEEDADYAKRS